MKLDHIVLLLSNVETCIGFYDLLLPAIGFSKVRDHVFSNAEGIHLDLRPAGEPEHGYRRLAPGLNHLGFTAESRDEVERVGALMTAGGFPAPPIQEYEDGCALFLRDADGMRIEVSWYQ